MQQAISHKQCAVSRMEQFYLVQLFCLNTKRKTADLENWQRKKLMKVVEASPTLP